MPNENWETDEITKKKHHKFNFSSSTCYCLILGFGQKLPYGFPPSKKITELRTAVKLILLKENFFHGKQSAMQVTDLLT